MSIDPDWSPEALRLTQLSGILGRLLNAMEIVRLQLLRLQSVDRPSTQRRAGRQSPTVPADIELLVLAIRNVLQLVARLEAVGVAIPESCDGANLDNLKDVRDVLSHLDDYLVGKGRLQSGVPGIPVTITFVHGASGLLMRLHNPDLFVDVGLAAADCLNLGDGALASGLREVQKLHDGGVTRVPMCLTDSGVIVSGLTDTTRG